MSERKLTDLDPSWNQRAGETIGVVFECPCCDGRDAHSILVPWVGPSPFPSGAIWKLESAVDFETLTLSPSVDLTRSGTCAFHGWVRAGKVTW